VFPTSSPGLLLKIHLVVFNDLFSHPPKIWLSNTPCISNANYFCSQGFTAQRGALQAAVLDPARGRAPLRVPQPSGHPSLLGGCRVRAGSRGMTPARLCRCLPEPGSISTSWHMVLLIVPKIGLPHCIVRQTCSGSKSNSLGFSKLTAWDFSASFHSGCQAHRDPEAQSSPGNGWPGGRGSLCLLACPGGQRQRHGSNDPPPRKFRFLLLM